MPDPIVMGPPKLYVAFCRPRYEDYIFGVTSGHPDFKRNVVNASPRKSQSFSKLIFLDIWYIAVFLEKTKN